MMKKILFIIFVVLLSGCTDGNNKSQDSYSCVGSGRGCKPYDPNTETPYGNFAKNSNKNITGMLSNNYDQRNKFIASRLGGYMITSVPVNDYDKIAQLALWLTEDGRTEEQIASKYYENSTLLHNALYVVNKSLRGCMNFGTADTGSSTAKCFMDWKKNNPEAFAKAAQTIYDNATVLLVQNAQITTANNAKLKILIDGGLENNGTGKIIAMTLEDTTYNRIGDTNTFANGDDVLTYKSVGKELGLSYSDFGTYDIINTNKQTPEMTDPANNVPFAGGYNSQKIAKSDIANNVHFTGQAVGNAHDSQHIVDLSGTATLAFDKESGTSTLGASFNNWYDIQVTDNGAIEFSNYTNKNNLVKLNATPDSDGVINDTGAKMDVGYYAPKPDTGVPTEATGLVQYTETASGVKMDIAFGAK